MATADEKPRIAGTTAQPTDPKVPSQVTKIDDSADKTSSIMSDLLKLPNLETAMASGWYARPPNNGEDDDSDDSSDNASDCSSAPAGDYEWDLLPDQEFRTANLNSPQRGVDDRVISYLATDLVRELIATVIMSPTGHENPEEISGEASDCDIVDVEEAGPVSIWDSQAQRDQALMKHRNASQNKKSIPAIFKHGIQYFRSLSGGKAGGKTDTKTKIQCRTLLITDLPDTIELSVVLAQLRGERIIKAHLVPKNKGLASPTAIVYFSKHEDAVANVNFYKENKMFFETNDTDLCEATVCMPATDTYPLSESKDIDNKDRYTRHVEFDHTQPSSIFTAMTKSGLRLKDFGNVVTRLCSDQFTDSYQVEFRSIEVAYRVRDKFLHLNKGSMATAEFIKDSCNSPFPKDLSAKRPVKPTSKLMKKFQSLMFEKEGEEPLPDESAHIRIYDDYTSSWESQGKPIVDNTEYRCETADWAGSHIKREEGVDHMGHLGMWEHDPISGARQHRAYINGVGGALGCPAMLHEEWIKEYLHYNMDSKNPEIRRTIDGYFAAHGLLNLRRVNEYVQDRSTAPHLLSASEKV